jgi:hypothetical protein
MGFVQGDRPNQQGFSGAKVAQLQPGIAQGRSAGCRLQAVFAKQCAA